MQKKMRKVEQTRGEKRVHFTPLIMHYHANFNLVLEKAIFIITQTSIRKGTSLVCEKKTFYFCFFTFNYKNITSFSFFTLLFSKFCKQICEHS